jgi:DUF971 family protein
MSVVPTALNLVAPDLLEIHWSDRQVRRYKVRTLRDACPCATCREKRTESQASAGVLPILRPEELQPLRITRMDPVGSYAYSIHFSDGHNTGIYTLDYLKELGEVYPAQ